MTDPNHPTPWDADYERERAMTTPPDDQQQDRLAKIKAYSPTVIRIDLTNLERGVELCLMRTEDKDWLVARVEKLECEIRRHLRLGATGSWGPEPLRTETGIEP